MNLWVVLPAAAVLIALRLLRARLPVWIVAWWAAMWVTLEYGFRTPVPQSAIHIYLGIVTAALLAYVGSSRDRIRSVFGPVLRVITQRTVVLAVVAVLLPALAAFKVYRSTHVPIEPPFFARTIHPSPPPTITVHGQEVNLITGNNPFRHLQTSDPDAYRQHVENGRTTFYQNCVFCHGDDLGGDGMFAHGLNPIPTNFQDRGVLPNFRESFFFWRISKGGPGLPEEGGPGDSAMPRWEQFLNEDQIWEVVLFLYDFTGYPPRSGGEQAEP